MTPAERQARIRERVERGGVVGFETLREALGVASATLERDLAALRDRGNVPIVFDRDAGGYRLAKSEPPPQYQLPERWFEPREALALLQLRAALRPFAGRAPADGLVGAELVALAERVQTWLARAGADADQVCERVRIAQAAVVRAGDPALADGGPCFEAIGTAVMLRERLELVVRGPRGPERHPREVSPQRLVCAGGRWVLQAWCHRSQALRGFALARIASARPLARRALEISRPRLERAFDKPSRR
jgi:predicted DNA-binding transcriptional regulator YafY